MLRKITKNDYKIFMELTNEFYSSNAVLHPLPQKYHEDTFEELMRSEEYISCYIIEYENKPAGYALTAKTYSHESGGIIVWVEELYIKAEFRSKGLGKEFFAFIENEYNTDVARFRLEVEEENIKAIKLYKKLGYEPLEYKQMIKDTGNA